MSQHAHRENGGRLDYDNAFEVLASERRRLAIRTLFEESPLEFATLVDRVAEKEHGAPIDSIDSDDRHAVYVSMQQTHSDRLERADVIVRDPADETISLGPNAQQLGEWLSITEDEEDEPGNENEQWRDGYSDGFADGFRQGRREANLESE